MVKCDICEKREGIYTFTDGQLSYIHGYFRRICKVCYIEILEDKKKSIEESLDELRIEHED